MRRLIGVVYRLRDTTLVAEKKDDFGNALQNLYRKLERAEDLAGPSGDFYFRLSSQKGQSTSQTRFDFCDGGLAHTAF